MSRMYPPTRRSQVAVRADLLGAPTHFVWRGRQYTVLTVLLSWFESAQWWRTASRLDDRAGQRIDWQARDWRLWRIEARADQGSGIYELATSDGLWFVTRVLD